MSDAANLYLEVKGMEMMFGAFLLVILIICGLICEIVESFKDWKRKRRNRK